MSFVWPEALWLLLLVPLLAWLYVWILRRRKRSVVRYANLAIVKAAMGRSTGWRRHVPPALLLLAVTVLIIAVARPQAVVTLANSRATVILAMDVSGSMRADDVKPSRIEASQAAAKKFIEEQPSNVEIGIVAFASIALLVQAPTVERDPLYAAIDNFDLRRGHRDRLRAADLAAHDLSRREFLCRAARRQRSAGGGAGARAQQRFRQRPGQRAGRQPGGRSAAPPTRPSRRIFRCSRARTRTR